MKYRVIVGAIHFGLRLMSYQTAKREAIKWVVKFLKKVLPKNIEFKVVYKEKNPFVRVKDNNTILKLTKIVQLEELIDMMPLDTGHINRELIIPVLKLYGIDLSCHTPSVVSYLELVYEDVFAPKIRVPTMYVWRIVGGSNIFLLSQYNDQSIQYYGDSFGDLFDFHVLGRKKECLLDIGYFSVMMLLLDPIQYFEKYNRLIDEYGGDSSKYGEVILRMRQKRDLYVVYLELVLILCKNWVPLDVGVVVFRMLLSLVYPQFSVS